MVYIVDAQKVTFCRLLGMQDKASQKTQPNIQKVVVKDTNVCTCYSLAADKN